MEPVEKRAKRAYKGGIRDSANAIAGLRRIVRAGRAEAGLAGIDIRIKGDPEKPGVAYCEVDIHGDTQADAEELAQELTDGGWTCTSTGEKDIHCTSE